jgi:hypothetical protein
MDKNKIYIAIIVVCVLVTGGVFYWSGQDQSAGLPDNIAPISTDIDTFDAAAEPTATAGAGLPDAKLPTEYAAPRVFPQDTKLNMDVFSSAKFSGLIDYTPMTVQPEEMNRPNPYLPY